MSYRAGLGVQFQQFVSLAALDILVPGALAQGVIPAVCLFHTPGYPHAQSAGPCIRCSSVSVQSSAAPKLSTQKDFLVSGSCWEGLYWPLSSHCRPCSLLWQDVTPVTSEQGKEKRRFDNAATGFHRMAEAGPDFWRS